MSSLIDPSMLDQLLNLEPDETARAELFEQIFSTYRDDNLLKAAELAQACAEGRMEEVKRLAHTMKGAALSIGATEVAEIALRCEELSEAGNEDLTIKINGLRDCLAQSLQALQDNFRPK